MVWLEDLLYMDMPGVLSIVRFDYGRVSCQNIEGQTWRENYTMLPGYTNHYHVPFPPSDQRFTEPQGFEKPRTNQPYVFCDGLQDIPSIIFLSQACGLQVAQLSWKFLAIPKLLVASKCYVPPLGHWVLARMFVFLIWDPWAKRANDTGMEAKMKPVDLNTVRRSSWDIFWAWVCMFSISPIYAYHEQTKAEVTRIEIGG